MNLIDLSNQILEKKRIFKTDEEGILYVEGIANLSNFEDLILESIEIGKPFYIKNQEFYRGIGKSTLIEGVSALLKNILITKGSIDHNPTKFVSKKRLLSRGNSLTSNYLCDESLNIEEYKEAIRVNPHIRIAGLLYNEYEKNTQGFRTNWIR